MKEAENLRFRKFKKPANQKIYDKEKRKKLEYLDPKVIKYEQKEFFNLSEMKLYEGGTFDTILTESEINLCAYSLLNSVKLKSSFSNLSEKLPLSIYPPLEEETAIFYLLKHQYIQEVVPLHSRSRSKENHKSLMDLVMYGYSAPVNEIRDYYGESIAIYFEWCNFMAKWLLIPGLIAFVLFLYEKTFADTETIKYYNGLFSFGIAVWAPLLLIYWNRRTNELNVEWDNYNLNLDPFDMRQQFKGEVITNPYTDRETLDYPSSQRLVRYLESFVITLPFILGAAIVMMLSLNMMGYTDESDMFYVAFFANFAKPGGIFEKGSLMACVPSILMTVSMVVICKFYEPSAEWATVRENHKTNEKHTNSLNVKKFAFNFIFFFSHLFYVAFQRKDLMGLRKELITLALVDEIRRIATESALPAILKNKSLHFEKKKWNTIVEEELDEISRPEYTYFEDYLELVIQYGYVTMFAAAFPLGALINYIFLFFERRSDTFKIENLCRRPLSIFRNDIGIWDEIMKAISYMSVFTNIFLFSFASVSAGVDSQVV